MKHLFEQLDQIAKHQPVFDGDLISKNDKTELVKLGLVMDYEDEDLKIPGYAKGVGGKVLTKLGKKIHHAMSLHRQIEKLKEELIEVERLIPVGKCPQCGTYNYHFKNSGYCCAFC